MLAVLAVLAVLSLPSLGPHCTIWRWGGRRNYLWHRLPRILGTLTTLKTLRTQAKTLNIYGKIKALKTIKLFGTFMALETLKTINTRKILKTLKTLMTHKIHNTLNNIAIKFHFICTSQNSWFSQETIE